MAERLSEGASLTPVDTAWLHMEDPTNLMMVTGIYIFDKPLDYDRLCHTVQARIINRFGRFSRCVERDGSKARWVLDRNFDIRSHVHRVALPAPADQRQLQEFVSDMMSTPLDFSKPLWQMHVVEGYGKGSVLLLRIHHCIGDGIALVHVLLSASDFTSDAPIPLLPPPRKSKQHGVLERITFLLFRAGKVVSATRKATGNLINQSVESLLHPSHVMEAAQNVLEGASVLTRLLLKPADPKTVFKGRLGVAKRAAWSNPIAVPDVKAVGQATGGTVNDVLLTAVCGALRRYLLSRAERPSEKLEINAMVPVNLRPLSEADQLGNRFGLIYLALPIGLGDPGDRLRLIKKRMDAIKKSAEPVVTFQILNALGLAPVEVADMSVKLFGAKSTAVMTNVIGPRAPIYFSGQRVRTAMFWVPQSGRMGMGISIFSYEGSVVVGFATDAGLVPDPEAIAQAFEDEFRSLQEWAGTRPASVRLLPAAPEETKAQKPRAPRKKAARSRP
ncbi:MAG: wax ester/triacylglycerol synthase family O-acyltransferase [Thermoanaerobaculia bacterium]|nr:wax ester/triacylglycerol synthase family O-acyltransferase [Thermoanaerobaculia bacterium]